MTTTLSRDAWLNVARCASKRSDIALREGDIARANRELDWWADIILKVNLDTFPA
jgi:hypothetical protein